MITQLALLEWAKRADAVVIENDYDGEFHYAGQPVECMQGLDTEGRVVYVGTFSRTIFPALRIGYMVVPKSLAPVFTAAKLALRPPHRYAGAGDAGGVHCHRSV